MTSRNVADVLVDPGRLAGKNATIGKRPRTHCWSVRILHVLYAERDKTLAGSRRSYPTPRRPLEQTLEAMMEARHLGEPDAIRHRLDRRANC